MIPLSEYAEVEVNHGIFEEYLQYGQQYDTVNDCPVISGETEFIPRHRLGKLSKDMRNMLKEYMNLVVMDYWESHRQIPVAGDLKQLRKRALDTLLGEFHIYLKDDKEVSVFLNDIVPSTINKLLKNEKTDTKNG